MILDYVESVNGILAQSKNLLMVHRERKRQKELLVAKVVKLEKDIVVKADRLEAYIRAATILGNVSDENTKATLNRITGVINKALAVIFTEDSRTISIRQTMYRNVHPHFIVELANGSGQVRSFKQSGTGLAQIISFLFTTCLVDARKGRKILVMDELLNGLHPYAKLLIRDLLIALSKRFQFVMVEYGVDVGKQYHMKLKGTSSSALLYSGGYYSDIAKAAK